MADDRYRGVQTQKRQAGGSSEKQGSKVAMGARISESGIAVVTQEASRELQPGQAILETHTHELSSMAAQ